MRTFNYSKIKELKWDSELLGLIAAIYKEAGKQEMHLKQRPEELEKLVKFNLEKGVKGFLITTKNPFLTPMRSMGQTSENLVFMRVSGGLP